MKINNFNKIGDTTFRVGNQINGYVSFANWLIECQGSQEFKKNPELEFRKWTKNSGIYTYPELEKDKIKNRFQIVLRQAEKIFKVIAQDSTTKMYKLNFTCASYINDILNSLTESDEETCIAFEAMLNFMFNNPSCKDAKKISKVFFVYEQGDDFLNLYNSPSLIDEIINKIPESDLLKTGKSSKEYKQLISNLKDYYINGSNFVCNNEVFTKNKKTYLTNFNNNVDFENFVKNNDKITVSKIICKNRLTQLLEGDYLDLFNRVLWGLQLSDSKSKNVDVYLNYKLRMTNENKYYTCAKQKTLNFPYTKDTCNEYLKKIQKKDFSFIEKDVHLTDIPNADIAEYFVNIKFCYVYNINPESATKFVNTVLDMNLFPVSHAPGRKSDMNYLEGGYAYGIETTIHSSVTSIYNHEGRPSIIHLENFANTKNTTKTILILVSPLGSNLEIKKWFEGLCINIPNFTYKFRALDFLDVASI